MKEYDLVFEGGGAKGSVFVGALEVFFAKNCKPRRFLGTSAGAITATLMAAGFGSDELLKAVNEKLENGKPRFSSFMDIPEEFDDITIKNSFIYAIFENIDFSLIPDSIENIVDKTTFKQLNKLKAF